MRGLRPVTSWPGESMRQRTPDSHGPRSRKRRAFPVSGSRTCSNAG